MQQRRDEIANKKAKLQELKRQRELRASSSGSSSRPSPGPQASSQLSSISSLGPEDFKTDGLADHLQLNAPASSRTDNRRDIENIINILVGESRAASSTGAASPARRSSRPNSVLSAGELSTEASDFAGAPPSVGIAVTPNPLQQPPTLGIVPPTVVFDVPPSPVKEVISYSKAVQTTDEWEPSKHARTASVISDSGDTPAGVTTTTPNKRLSRRRERDREEDLRQNIRREIEEELRAARDLVTEGVIRPEALSGANFPSRSLTTDELEAVTSSDDFRDFVEKSTKVIERALEQETYDILTDYAQQGLDLDEDEDDDPGNTGGKGRRRVKETVQFYDERWSKKRMVTSIDFSSKFPELLLASYTKNPAAPHDPGGLVQVWNAHMQDRPEFVFTAQSDVLTARFAPFHPNLIVGGCYSGQVLLWDTRSKSAAPVQRTPLTGFGHTHPVYAVDLVGTQNANNIISCSTDGAVCAWSMDVFAQPQETLMLRNPGQSKLEDVNPTCLAFPQADPTFFLVGTEEGTIFPCHRYDRAGAKAGADQKVSYRGHAAPVTSVDFHPARGPIDLGDLVLSSSLDWTVRLWRVRAPAATSTALGGVAGTSDGQYEPLLDFVREDVVYDARWSPVRPSVFALVDGAGWLELWDVALETEEPVARILPMPQQHKDGGGRAGPMARSLNRVAWEPSEGKRLATGGMEGVVTVFEVGPGLGGREGGGAEEWTGMKKLVNRVEAMGVNGTVE